MNSLKHTREEKSPIKGKKDLLAALGRKKTVEAVALAYLVNEIIPDDRTLNFFRK